MPLITAPMPATSVPKADITATRSRTPDCPEGAAATGAGVAGTVVGEGVVMDVGVPVGEPLGVAVMEAVGVFGGPLAEWRPGNAWSTPNVIAASSTKARLHAKLNAIFRARERSAMPDHTGSLEYL
jgi:hypothetical protein